MESKTIEDRSVDYLELFGKVRSEVGDDQIALGILQELGKDSRVERMRLSQERVEARTNGDEPATGKQIGYLKFLGVQIPEGLTKQQASELIDEAQGKAFVDK